MKKQLFMGLMLLMSLTAMGQTRDQFISDLMSKMTVEEKIGQLNLMPAGSITTGVRKDSPRLEIIAQGKVGAILNMKGFENIRRLQDAAVKRSRLGIPLMIGMDVVHGYETIFPIPLAQSCSWDLEAIEQCARIAAKEATADGVNWTYSPMVDIALDARWGRIAEGSGEDPFLGSRIAEAMVRGYQGSYGVENMMACVKHYALYGAAEAGRDYNTVDMSHIRMYNQFFPPYKAAAKAGAGSFMTSFNVVDYIPATANRWLLDDVLRKQWGWKGFIVTDYASIEEITKHGLGDLYDLGLFKDPYRFLDEKRHDRDVYTEENRKAAREMAAKSFVLLKNENQLLPLKKQGKIALIGPMADNRINMAGTWSVAAVPDKYSTLKEAMMRAVHGKATVLCAQGCNFTSDSLLQDAGSHYRKTAWGDPAKMHDEAIGIAKEADVIVCAMGEEAEMSGESSSRTDLQLFDVQKNLLTELLALGKPLVLLNFSGRPTVMTWEQQHVPAIMNVWFGGSESGDAICDLYYNQLPTGRPAGEGAEKFSKFLSNYLDVRNDALYPFGYGLSYTHFEYSDIRLNGRTASVTVTNAGNYDADEIVQLYIHDVVASISRPTKELKGFQRIHLKKGESREVKFEITDDLLKFYNYNLENVLEPGDFEIMIGPDSSLKHLRKATLTVQ